MARSVRKKQGTTHRANDLATGVPTVSSNRPSFRDQARTLAELGGIQTVVDELAEQCVACDEHAACLHAGYCVQRESIGKTDCSLK